MSEHDGNITGLLHKVKYPKFPEERKKKKNHTSVYICCNLSQLK